MSHWDKWRRNKISRNDRLRVIIIKKWESETYCNVRHPLWEPQHYSIRKFRRFLVNPRKSNCVCDLKSRFMFLTSSDLFSDIPSELFLFWFSTDAFQKVLHNDMTLSVHQHSIIFEKIGSFLLKEFHLENGQIFILLYFLFMNCQL